MKQFTEEDELKWAAMVNQKVWKKSNRKTTPKPFKSGLKVNTVKSIVMHKFFEDTMQMGFTFHEDDSVVQCWRCSLSPKEE